jgi:tRNA A37 methylthiotransferase MiaB
MGMETSLWGIEFGSSYPELLKEILNLDKNIQVHVAQFQPTGIKRYYDSLLELFSNKRVTDIQLPIQSTSKRIMRMMKRQELSSYVGPFMQDLRKRNPRAVLRTDLIICWPTETLNERIDSLNFAGKYFDEIALYTIELSPDLPAWEYQKDALDEKETEIIRRESKNHLLENFKNIVVHSGQQDDDSMESAEKKRIELRKKKNMTA